MPQKISLINDKRIVARPFPPDFGIKGESTNNGNNCIKSEEDSIEAIEGIDVACEQRKMTRFDFYCNPDEKHIQKLNFRRLEEMRNMYIKVNVFRNAWGSAYLRLGNTKIIAAVYGPRHFSYSSFSSSSSSNFPSNSSFASCSSSFSFSSSSRSVMCNERGLLHIDFKLSPFAFSHSANQFSKKEELKDLSYIIDALHSVVKLEKYPMSLIDIHVTILESHGELFSSILNCIGLAIADASIEMRDCIAVSTVYSIPVTLSNGIKKYLIALDLTSEELEEYSNKEDFSLIHVGFCVERGLVFFLHGERNKSNDDTHLDNMLTLGEAACRAIGQEIQNCLRFNHVKKLKTIRDKNIAIYGKKIYNTKVKDKENGEEYETETEEEVEIEEEINDNGVYLSEDVNCDEFI